MSLKDLAGRAKNWLSGKLNDNEGFVQQGKFTIQPLQQALQQGKSNFQQNVRQIPTIAGNFFQDQSRKIEEVPVFRANPFVTLGNIGTKFVNSQLKSTVYNPETRKILPASPFRGENTSLPQDFSSYTPEQAKKYVTSKEGVSRSLQPIIGMLGGSPGSVATQTLLSKTRANAIKAAEPEIMSTIKSLENINKFSPEAQMKIMDDAEAVAKKYIPDLLKRPELQSLKRSSSVEDYLNVVAKALEDRMNTAFNPQLNIGNNIRRLQTKKSAPITTITPLKEELAQQTGTGAGGVKLRSPAKSELKVANIASEGILPEKGRLNVKNLNLTDEGKATVRAGDKAPVTVIGHKQTVEKAAELGARKQAFSQTQIEDIVAQQHAARQEVVTAVNELDRLKKAGASQLELLAQADKINEATNVARSGAKLGGTLLEAQKIMADEVATPVQKIVAMIKEAGVPYEAFKNDLINVDFNDANQAVAFFRKYVPPTWSDILTEVRYTNMLSSPLTHITNIAGNILQTGIVRPIARIVEGAVDWTKSILTGSEQKYFASSGLDYAKGYYSALPEAIKKSWKILTGAAAELKPDFDPTKLPAFTKGSIGHLYTTPLRALEASDQFFKTLVKSGEVRAGMTLEEAAKSADYQLFRQAFDPTGKLGQGGVLKLFDKWNNFIAGLRRLPSGNWIVPFLQTPTNILKQGLEYSPLGVVTIPGAKEPIQQLTKAIIGTTVFTAASGIASNGLSTWSMPTNPKEKELFMAAGMQPYSVKIGDKWVSYSKLGPLAYPIAMAAAYHDVATRNPDATTAETLGDSLVGTLGFFADQSYVRSLGDFIGAIQGKGSFGGGFSLDSMSKQAANLAGQLIPYDAFQGWLTRLVDPVYRKPEGFVQQLQAGIPGQSQKLEAYTNPDGTPSQRDLPGLNAVSPYKVSQEKPAYTDLYSAQKQNVIQAGVEKRMGESLKEGEVKTSGNKIMFIDTDGKVQTADLTPITPPEKTGNETLDKMNVTEYKSAITKQKKAIKALYDAGKLSKEEAIKLLDELQVQYESSSSGSGKKGTSIKIKPMTFKMPGLTQTKSKFKQPETIQYAKAPITKLSTPKPRSIKIAQRTPKKSSIKIKAYRNTLAGK